MLNWSGVSWPGINAPGFGAARSIYLLRMFNPGTLWHPPHFNVFFCEAGFNIPEVNGRIFLTSADMVNWEAHSRTFGMVYFEGQMYAIFDGGICRMDASESWHRLELPENMLPTSISVESGLLRLNYFKQQSEEVGLMLSRDGKTWHDISEGFEAGGIADQRLYVITDEEMGMCAKPGGLYSSL